MLGRSNPYVAMALMRFREVVRYRAAAIAGVFTQIVFGFIIFMTLEAFRRSSPALAPMDRRELLAYVWLGQALLWLFPWNMDRDVQEMLKDGTIAYELSRPVDLYALWYARALGWRVSSALTRCAPLVLIVTMVFPLIGLGDFRLPPPAGTGAFLAFLLALSVAVVLGVALTVAMQVLALCLHNVEGVQRVAPSFILILSGQIVPLPMFPDSLQRVIYLLPFRGLVDLPFRSYSGHLGVNEALTATALAALWVLVLIALGRALLARTLRRVVVHGG